VKLQAHRALSVYATIDTGSQLSVISEQIANQLELRRDRSSALYVAGAGRIEAELSQADVLICDEAFSPWIELTAVPFAIAENPQTGVVLGYESCLARLRVTLDYPAKVVEVEATRSLLAKRRRNDGIPARIDEGAELITSGSYTSGVILLSAGVEELLRRALGIHEGYSLSGMPDLHASGMSPAAIDNVRRVRDARNMAVHSLREIDAFTARGVLAAAQIVVAELETLAVGKFEPRSATPSQLTAREVQVLQHVAQGRSTREIADLMTLSSRTIEKHLATTMRKLGASSRTEAVVKAIRTGRIGEPGVPSTLVLTAAPAAVLGGESSRVTAMVTDASGNNVHDGEPVAWTLDGDGAFLSIQRATANGRASVVVLPAQGKSAAQVTVVCEAPRSGVKTSVRVEYSPPST
jgi:DNA-binding CsgD family transcriptional regulator